MCCVLLTLRESEKQWLFGDILSGHPCSAGALCHRQPAFICSLVLTLLSISSRPVEALWCKDSATSFQGWSPKAWGMQQEKLMMSPGIYQYASEDRSTVGANRSFFICSFALAIFSLSGSMRWSMWSNISSRLCIICSFLFSNLVCSSSRNIKQNIFILRCKIKFKSFKSFHLK